MPPDASRARETPLGRYAIHPEHLQAAGPYSHAVATSALVYLSGKTGVDPKSGELVAGGTAAEARQVFANLAEVLKASGCDFSNVVKCNVYLVDMNDFAAMNAVYAEQFAAPYPARTTVAVAALPGGARIEIEMVAEGGPLAP